MRFRFGLAIFRIATLAAIVRDGFFFVVTPFRFGTLTACMLALSASIMLTIRGSSDAGGTNSSRPFNQLSQLVEVLVPVLSQFGFVA